MNLEDIRKVAVLGTGTMAPGIAQVFAHAGYSVRIWARTEESVQRGLNRLESSLKSFSRHRLIGPEERSGILSRVKGGTDFEESVRYADFVVESVAENLDLKREIFARLDRAARSTAILATNTSGLSITQIASGARRPDRMVVTHFWNPPPLVPLVEIVGNPEVSEETISITRALMVRIGKTPVVLKKDAPGFIGNRLQFALLREALYIVEQGIASKEDVDTACKASFGRRLPVTGPLESADLGGLDVFLAISEYLMKELCSSGEASALLADAVKNGRLGAKSGRGLYELPPESARQLLKAREDLLISFLKSDRKNAVHSDE